MKHAFHVHSNSCYVSALLIIDYHGLPVEDCVLFVFRSVKVDSTNFNVVYIDDDLYLHSFNSIRNFYKLTFLKNRFYVKAIDSLIEKTTKGDSFVYYAPHCRNPLYQIFITNPGCKQVHYIEDGMDAYIDLKNLYFRFPKEKGLIYKTFDFFLSILDGVSKVSRTSRFTNLYENIGFKQSVHYGLSDNSFLFSNSRIVLPFSERIKAFSFGKELTYKNVLLLDAVVEQGVISEEQFKSFFSWFFRDFFQGDGIDIKFHPMQSKECKKILLRLAQDNEIDYNLVDENLIELDIVTYKNLCVYGIGSSLLNFASMTDRHEVYALYGFFNDGGKEFSTRYALWNETFGNNGRVIKFES